MNYLYHARNIRPYLYKASDDVKRQDRRSDCPVNYALEAVGDTWSLLIIRDLMFEGKRTYSEFADSKERVSTNILSNRLKGLIAKGIIRREGLGRTTRYYLTRKGLDLLPVMVELLVWSGRHDPNTTVPPDLLSRALEDRPSLLAELEAELITAHKLEAVG